MCMVLQKSRMVGVNAQSHRTTTKRPTTKKMVSYWSTNRDFNLPIAALARGTYNVTEGNNNNLYVSQAFVEWLCKTILRKGIIIIFIIMIVITKDVCVAFVRWWFLCSILFNFDLHISLFMLLFVVVCLFLDEFYLCRM